MRFYGHWYDADLGDEPCGGSNRTFFELKTVAGARRRMQRFANGRPWRLWTFTRTYNNATYREVGRSH